MPSMPDGSKLHALTDTGGRIEFVNPAFTAITGYMAKRLNVSGHAPLKVAVNFPPRQLEQPGLTARVLEVLARTGLPISTLKIDKSFIDGLPGDRDGAAIVSSVISIAANMGLDVIAEGVETPEQLEFAALLEKGKFAHLERLAP